MSELALWLAVERLRGLVLAEESAPWIRSVTEHLDALPGELNRLQLLLKGKKIQLTDSARQIQERVRQIEYLAYGMEDVIEAHRVEGKSRRRRSGVLKTIFRVDSQLTPQRMRSQIEKSAEEIENALNKEDQAQKLANHHLFGIEQEKTQVLGLVLAGVGSDIPESSSSSSHLGALDIPIFGVIGSGKTTLAKEIYEDQIVAKKFKIRIWINVPDKFKTRDILREIHEHINGRKKLNQSEEQLLEEIERSLKSQRSLIVLDDIRSVESWKTLRITLPRMHKGSRIVVTTRVESVAEYISRNQDFHTMRALNEDQRWDLFTKVFSPPYPPAKERMVTVRKVIRSCEGVPRLIKELAFYLASKQVDEWEKECANIRTYVSAFFSTVYRELSDHLRPCFLHLGQFSENLEIDTEKLFHLWIIEGFLSTTARARGERMMDLTERYLEELARKNIVELQEEEVPTMKKFKACSIVGGLESLCVSWGEQKLFLKIVDLRKYDCSLSSETLPPRLVVYLGNHVLAVACEVVKTVRSLRVVGRTTKQLKDELIWPTEMLNLKEFRVLRILDFEGIDFHGQKLPGGISNLVLLRYLSFKGCVLEELPSYIGKLLYLQVLDLRVKESAEMLVANVLWKFRRLKHLYLPLKFRTRIGEKLRLDGLKELETIENFNTRVCKVNDVSEFLKIRCLAAKVERNFDDFETITSYMQTTSNSWLCTSIDIIDLDCYAEETHSVLRGLLRCQVLRILHFKGHIGYLPPHDEISQNFTQLVLNNSHLKEDPMPTLEKLPNLGILILSDDAYMGKDLVCSASGFPQLKHLQLVNLHLLEKFEVKNTAMPILSNLKISNCRKYDHIIPDCLNNRSSRHHLKILLS